jgi:outer membrane protein assembly factor BamB
VHRHSRVASGLGVGVIAVVISLLSTVLGQPTMRFVTHEAADFVPADGFRLRFLDAGSRFVMTGEWARDETVAILGSGPEVFGHWVNVAASDPTSVGYARWTRTDVGSGTVRRSEALLTIEPAGVLTNAVRHGGLSYAYVPGKVTLTGDVRDGAAWQSTGVVRPFTPPGFGPPTPYEARFRAIAAPEAGKGCLTVTEIETIGSASPVTTTATWCPGQGIVAMAAKDGSWIANPANPATPVDSDVRPFDWGTVDRLQWTTTQVSHLGPSLVSQSPVAPPGALPDGTVVFANRVGRDLVAVRPGATSPETAQWQARPGGSITTAATLGSLTVAVTTERRAVAYGPVGEWLWSTDLDDIARIPPFPFAGGVAIVTLTGRLTLLEPDTGAERWTVDVGGEVGVPPIVTDGSLVVADSAGGIMRYSDSGGVLWRQSLPDAVDHMAVAGGVIVVLPHLGSTLRGLDLDSGDVRWRRLLWTPPTGLSGHGDVVVARTDDSLMGLDPGDGAERWRVPVAAVTVAGGPGRVLVLTASDLRVLSAADGGSIVRVPLGLAAADMPQFVSVGAGRIVLAADRTIVVGSLP